MNQMQLAERHIVDRGDLNYKEIDAISFLSKNLYNAANYIVRQEFIWTSKEKEWRFRDHAVWIRYNKLQKMMQDSKNPDYEALPRKISQHVLKQVDKNWKSFFESIKDWKKFPEKYTGRPSLPDYKDKTKGRNSLVYTIQAISAPELRKGIALLSGTSISVSTQQKNICQVRISPKKQHYVIEVIYKKEVNDLGLDKNKIASIDLGLDNLAAITSNQRGFQPLLINGRPLKSMNQFYNKELARVQSFVGNKSSNRIIKLSNKRNRKIDNYLHNASRDVVDILIANGIGTLVIGKNKQWKTEINIGKKNNQEFVDIPHARFIEMLTYKCELVGIKVVPETEEYTSKCSFIDMEPIKKHETYAGKRIKRGLFRSANGTLINADCNGSGNILRKAFPNAFADGIEGVVVSPVRITPYKLNPCKQAA